MYLRLPPLALLNPPVLSDFFNSGFAFVAVLIINPRLVSRVAVCVACPWIIRSAFRLSNINQTFRKDFFGGFSYGSPPRFVLRFALDTFRRIDRDCQG